MKNFLLIAIILMFFSCSTITNYSDPSIEYDKLIQGKDFMYIFIPTSYNTADITSYKSGVKKYDAILKSVDILDKYALELSNDKNLPFSKSEIKLEINDLENRIIKLNIIKDFSGSKTTKAINVANELEKSKNKLSNLKKLFK